MASGMKHFCIDAETFLIERGVLDPEPICWSYGYEGEEAVVTKSTPEAMEAFTAALWDPETRVIGQNFAYDAFIGMIHGGLSLALLARELDAGRVSDVAIRETLLAVARGWTSAQGDFGGHDPRTGRPFETNLAAQVKAHFKVDIGESKKDADAWRKRYAELANVPLNLWPKEAVDYPKADIDWPLRIWRSQAQSEGTPVGPIVKPDGTFVNEAEQVRAAFVLHYMAINGPRTDPGPVRKFRSFHQKIADEGFEFGQKGGFLWWNPKRFADANGKKTLPGWSERQIAMHRLVAKHYKNRIPWKALTETGQKKIAIAKVGQDAWDEMSKGQRKKAIKSVEGQVLEIETDADLKGISLSQENLAKCVSDPNLVGYAKGANSRKMINQYASILELALKQPLTSSPNVLVSTGRISWAKPNMTNPPREGGFRECFIPRAGMVYAFADYSFIEMCTVAQLQLWEQGRSRLAEVINSGQDPHTWLASIFLGISYEETLARKKAGDKDVLTMRQAAKACFVAGTEVYTRQGWVAVEKLTMGHEIAQAHMPEEMGKAPRAEFVKPLRLTTRWSDNVIRLQNESVDLGLTSDHRIPTYGDNGRLKTIQAKDLNKARHWCSAVTMAGGFDLPEAMLRLAVAVQADGSVTEDRAIRMGFTKKRKIARMSRLLQEAGVPATSSREGYWYIRKADAAPLLGILGNENSAKGLPPSWRHLSESSRAVVLDEAPHWDSHVRAGRRSFQYFSTDAISAETMATLAVVSGMKATLKQIAPTKGSRSAMWSVSVKRRCHTRGGNVEISPLPAQQVYCLTVPTQAILVRSGGKHAVVRNCNFGVPGGMGPARIVETYWDTVGDEGWLMLAEDHEVMADDGELDIVATAFNVAKRLRKMWLDTFPEQKVTFKHISRLTRKSKANPDGKRFSYRQRPWGNESGCEVSVGRIRGKVGYCDGANTPFQGLASDGIKAAIWDIFKAAALDRSSPLFGVRLWLMVHDEVGAEGPEETAHIWAPELSRLMVAAMRRYCPDVKISADAALCRRWYKGADPVYDENGKLVPWEPWRKVVKEGNKADPVHWHSYDWVLDHVSGQQAFAVGPRDEAKLAAIDKKLLAT